MRSKLREQIADDLELLNLSSDMVSELHRQRRPFSNQPSSDSDLEPDPDLQILGDNNRSSFNSARLRQLLSKIWNGPAVPEDLPPQPIERLWRLESIPHRVSNLTYRVRTIILIAYLILWFLVCYLILADYMTVPPWSDNGSDQKIILVNCGQAKSFWLGKNGRCGMNGELCPLLLESEDVIFRCPALCDRGAFTFLWIPVGDQNVKYRGYYVGGGALDKPLENGYLTKPYRADSFPCGAATHGGLILPFFGGCVRASWTGSQGSFESAKGSYGVSDSVGFALFFPKLFAFKQLLGLYHNCRDPRLLILAVNIILGAPVVFLSQGVVAFWVVSMSGFWTIMFATDPPFVVDAASNDDLSRLVLLALERLLPICFILYVLWTVSIKRTLGDYGINWNTFTSQFSANDHNFTLTGNSETATPSDNQYSISESEEEGTPIPRRLMYSSSRVYRVVLFYPFFWLGVLNNITFDRLPVDRLTWADLTNQPGAIFVVFGLVIVVAICAVVQAYKLWLLGRFQYYLKVYVGFIVVLGGISCIPGLVLRVHHYILALLLIPGCATRGKTALAFQGILLGLFLSGAARWGLALIAETTRMLLRDDPKGTLLPPGFESFDAATGILTWNGTLNENFGEYDGISLLVNDIERWVGPYNLTLEINLTKLLKTKEIKRLITKSLQKQTKDTSGNIPIYLRIGRKILGSLIYGDFSKAAVLNWPSKEFYFPEEGIT